ncbi:hypothetical protein [Homoserinimonas hongtaonis]|nr:hypothetical protein [Salinibacterium hongtaonis]
MRIRFISLLLVVVLVAVGYALTSRGAAEGISGAELITALSSNERFQTFVALPVWLIAASIMINRALMPQRLVRWGARRSLAFDPFWPLLVRFVLVAAVVSVVWLGIALATMPTGSDHVLVAMTAVGVLAGAAALLAIGFATLYWLLLTVRLVFRSRQVTLVVAMLIWVFSVMPNIGVFLVPHPLNLAQYVAAEYVRSRPSLFVTLLIAAVLALVLCSAVARWRDAGAHQPHPDRRATALWIALFVGAVGAVALNHTDPAAAPALSTVFVGVSRSVVEYLIGMTVILSLSLAATARFATDWTQRGALVRIRSRTTTRWVTATLAGELGWVAHAVLIVAAAIVCFRFAALGGDTLASASEIAAEAALLGRLLVSVALVVILLILGIVVFGSEAAPAAIGCTILVLGLFPPLWSPWNPLLAWSGQWAGEAATIASTVLVLAAAFCFGTLVLVLKLAHESEVRRVHH